MSQHKFLFSGGDDSNTEIPSVMDNGTYEQYRVNVNFYFQVEMIPIEKHRQ